MQERSELFIGGQWVAPLGAERLQVVSPATEEVIASVPAASEADVDRAVASARRCFDEGSWRNLTFEERADGLRRIAAELWPRVEEIAQTITAEMGATIESTRLGQAPAPIAMLEYYASMSDAIAAEEERVGLAASGLIVREPVGVVAAIVPWNAPLWLAMYKLAPALLAGCSVVVKPSPETPLSAYLLAEAVEAAGLPAGTVSVIAADRKVGQHLVEHPGVDKVAFTGSTAAGRQIMKSCAETFKRVTLELGGKSAAIFLEDVDLATAIPAYLPGAIINNGEACAALTRVLVPASRHDEVVDALCAAFAGLPVGDPFDESTVIGPMVSAAHRERVEGYIRLGQDEGAKVAWGGGRPAGLGRGWYVEPTVLVGVGNEMRVAREEIFGPVVTVIPYESEAEAVSIANDSDYGLAGSVFTSDVDRGLAIGRQIRVGTFTVNGFTLDIAFPFGGFKQSGIGREGGPEGLAGYLESRTICLPDGHHG